MFHVKHMDDNKIYKLLYKKALKAYKIGEIPVSSIIIYNNKIIGIGYNNKEKNNNVLGHAEINAIIDASKKIKDWRLNDCTLITTLKPCNLCNQAIIDSRINEVYFYLDQKDLKYKNNYKKIESDSIYLIKYKKLFNDFFINLR